MCLPCKDIRLNLSLFEWKKGGLHGVKSISGHFSSFFVFFFFDHLPILILISTLLLPPLQSNRQYLIIRLVNTNKSINPPPTPLLVWPKTAILLPSLVQTPAIADYKNSSQDGQQWKNEQWVCAEFSRHLSFRSIWRQNAGQTWTDSVPGG